MKNKTQRIKSYISGAGLKVYEAEQYNKQTNSWYIVGDCSTNKKFIQVHINLHNLIGRNN